LVFWEGGSGEWFFSVGVYHFLFIGMSFWKGWRRTVSERGKEAWSLRRRDFG